MCERATARVGRVGLGLVACGLVAASAAAMPLPLSISKAFGAPSIPLNGTTTVTFVISVGTSPQSGIGFTDTLPPGLVVANPSGFTSNCGAGDVTVPPDYGSITFAGGSLAALTSCSIALNVTGT